MIIKWTPISKINLHKHNDENFPIYDNCVWFSFRWGKRAAHNRAQIVYYVAENLELRREEFASRISEMTGKTVEECREEVDMSIRRLFHWGAYADKYGGQVQVMLVLYLLRKMVVINAVNDEIFNL